ncbi:MAG: signal recognition particle-docking protein FtsY [Candidatus Latescibacteria bacterium]|nr:signal recognition particle-docking protein FtsY [Candidatus Latescibacterota bacterium]
MLRGLFNRLKEGLTKTRANVVERIAEVVRGRPRLDEAALEEIERILIEADTGVDAALHLVETLRERVRAEGLPEEGVNRLLKEEILRMLKAPAAQAQAIDPPPGAPRVILVVGVNGVGKTTTIGKLAARYAADGKRVTLAACDTFRAAAIDQLAVWADRAGAHLVRHQPGADPASVAFDALAAARARGTDVVIVDTAGRLHTKVNLMEELKKVCRVIQKAQADAPHETLLVLDATTGQNAVAQAQQFHATLGLTGIVLTKLDGTAKGGIVIAISRSLNIPVRMVGLGEGIDDLQDFDPEAFADALFEGG